MVNGWKVTAIIFIVLFILETAAFIVLLKLGNDVIEKEEECMWNICEGEEYISYNYDSFTGLCSCYTEDDQERLVKYIG